MAAINSRQYLCLGYCPVLSSVQQDKNYLHSGGHALGMPINILWSLLLLVQVLYCNFINLSVGWKGGRRWTNVVAGLLSENTLIYGTFLTLSSLLPPSFSDPTIYSWTTTNCVYRKEAAVRPPPPGQLIYIVPNIKYTTMHCINISVFRDGKLQPKSFCLPNTLIPFEY